MAPPTAAYPLAVAQAWQASAEQAVQDCPAARELLQLLAFFSPDAIPRDLLGAAPSALPEGLQDGFDRDGAIEALARFSLLRAEAGTLSIHRMVQAATRDVLDQDVARARAETAVRLVAAARPRPPQEHTNWPAMASLLPHALAAADAGERLKAGLEPTAAVLNAMAVYHMARAVWAEAEPLFTRAIAISEKALGPEHPDLATWLNNLANLYQDTGRHAEAEPLFTRALAIMEKRLPPAHPSLATVRQNYAVLLEALGRADEAATLRARAAAP